MKKSETNTSESAVFGGSVARNANAISGALATSDSTWPASRSERFENHETSRSPGSCSTKSAWPSPLCSPISASLAPSDSSASVGSCSVNAIENGTLAALLAIASRRPRARSESERGGAGSTALRTLLGARARGESRSRS